MKYGTKRAANKIKANEADYEQVNSKRVGVLDKTTNLIAKGKVRNHGCFKIPYLSANNFIVI